MQLEKVHTSENATDMLTTTNQKSPVAKAIPLILLVSVSGASLNLATKSGVFRDDGFASTRLKLADFTEAAFAGRYVYPEPVDRSGTPTKLSQALEVL